MVSIRKQYAGHAKRVLMFGLWSVLRQFMYTKFIIVVDEDVNPRDWKGSGMGDDDPHGPGAGRHAGRAHADRLPGFRLAGFRAGGKMGLDATNKLPGETDREWGRPIVMDQAVKQKVDAMWGNWGSVTTAAPVALPLRLARLASRDRPASRPGRRWPA